MLRVMIKAHQEGGTTAVKGDRPVIEQQNHSYEELRAVVVDLLLRRETVRYEVNQFRHLIAGVAEVLARRAGALQEARGYLEPHLS